MNAEQELRGEIRELLSQTLVKANAAEKDSKNETVIYDLGYMAALRSVLNLMSKEN